MKPIVQQILLGLLGCVVLILMLSLGLSWVVNETLAEFEAQGTDFLPTSGENSSEPPTP